MNGGDWHKDTPKNTDSEITDLISWMHTEDKHTRPQMRDVAAKLKELKANFDLATTQEKTGTMMPKASDLFNPEEIAAHKKLSQLHSQLPSFFPAERTPEEENPFLELHQEKPEPINRKGLTGKYIGATNI